VINIDYSHTFGRSLRRVLKRAEERGIDSLVLLHAPNIFYVSGVREPTGFAVVSESCGNYIGTSVLDYSRISHTSPKDFEILAFYRGHDEMTEKIEIGAANLVKGDMKDALELILKRCDFKKVGFDKRFLNVQLIEAIESISKNLGIEIVDFTDDIIKVRSVKEDWEIDLIVKAQRIAEKALRKALDALNDKVSELEIAGIIKYEMLKEGAWGESFPPIVAFHENSAYPHHTPTERPLGPSGAVLIDLGSVYKGYMSDMTRTLWWGDGGEKFKNLIEIVVESQESAIDLISPGVAAWEPDNAARKVLEKRGLSKYFIHGLGHGVGVEIHESPYLRPGSKEVLEPGNVVTAEPGIYIPGLYGVRVEDMVLVTKKGRKVLSSLSRILM
jgi:Xaa-Pro dipeptidase